MGLLEPNPGKRITAKMALEHEYFSRKRGSLEEDELQSVEQKLKSFNERKFQTKHIQQLNETLYIPVDLPSCSEFIPSGADSAHFLFTNKPCMNGLVNTCERINSGRSTAEDVFKLICKKTGSFDIAREKESPGLKKRLTEESSQPRVCFYQRKGPHKISDFLDYRPGQLEKFNIKAKENFMMQNQKEGNLGLLSPMRKERSNGESSPQKKERRTDSFDL